MSSGLGPANGFDSVSPICKVCRIFWANRSGVCVGNVNDCLEGPIIVWAKGDGLAVIPKAGNMSSFKDTIGSLGVDSVCACGGESLRRRVGYFRD